MRVGLAAEGVAVLDHAAIPEHHARLRERYLEEIFPVLTPLAVAPGHPFPYISTLSLSLAVVVRDPDGGEQRFARVKVPQILPRLVAVGRHAYVPLEQVIAANLDVLFPGLEIVESHPFRVTRDADFDIEEDEAGDLVSAIEHELRRRRFGSAVRLEVEDGDAGRRARLHPRRASGWDRTTCTPSPGSSMRPASGSSRPSTCPSCATRPGSPSSRPG